MNLPASIKPVVSELTEVETIVNICDINADKPLPGLDYEEFLATGFAGTGSGH